MQTALKQAGSAFSNFEKVNFFPLQSTAMLPGRNCKLYDAVRDSLFFQSLRELFLIPLEAGGYPIVEFFFSG
jgi:hypothetical protein